MDSEINVNSICVPSEDVVARTIEGEIILIPIAAGIGDMEDELYSLNATGGEIWNRLDGVRSLWQIADELAVEYEGPAAEIERDVLGLIGELAQRKMVQVR